MRNKRLNRVTSGTPLLDAKSTSFVRIEGQKALLVMIKKVKVKYLEVQG